MMSGRFLLIATICGLSLCQLSCGQAKPVIKNKVLLTHVKGNVLVDGVPKEGVWVRYAAISDTAEPRPEYKVGVVFTGPNGEFTLKTYEEKDGVPAGQYGLNFRFSAKKQKDVDSKYRPELLPRECTDIKKPYQTFQVEQGQDLDLGEITLKTKPLGMSAK